MNLTVKLTDLRRIVDLVSAVTPTRTTLPSLNAVLLAYDDCVLTASATDLRSFARAHCDAVGEQSGAFGVKAALLCDYLSRCTHEDVDIETDKTAKFICGNNEATFTMIVPEEFKEHPEVIGTPTVMVAEELLHAIEFTSVAVADGKDGKPEYVAISFDFDDYLDVVALNGKLISICSMPLSETKTKSRHLLPDFMVPLIKSVLTGKDGTVMLTFSDSMVEVFVIGQWSIKGPLLNLNYPDWRNRLTWLNTRDGSPLKFNRKELHGAFLSCIPFGEAGFVRVYVHGDGKGEAVVEISGQDQRMTTLKYEGVAFEFFVNARHMAPMLNSLSADDVTLEFSATPGVGIVIHENNFTAAIMPLEKYEHHDSN